MGTRTRPSGRTGPRSSSLLYEPSLMRLPTYKCTLQKRCFSRRTVRPPSTLHFVSKTWTNNLEGNEPFWGQDPRSKYVKQSRKMWFKVLEDGISRRRWDEVWAQCEEISFGIGISREADHYLAERWVWRKLCSLPFLPSN
jgi:hypothetical protein